jgi:hypothetical protein
MFIMSQIVYCTVNNNFYFNFKGRIESTIRQAMASVPTVNGTTVNFKIVVVNDTNNCGPITFL